MFGKILRADFCKIKGTSVMFSHILIPVMISAVFLLYYTFSPWDVSTKLGAFYQTIGSGLPVLIGIFAASVMEQEQNAGNFQNMLLVPNKRTTFLTKLSLLLFLCLVSILLTAIIFGFVFGKMTDSDISNLYICIQLSVALWLSSIPLYIWQIILAFQFGKGMSVSVGIATGLINALMLTGLGDYIWRYVFVSWTGRIPYTFLRILHGQTGAYKELLTVLPYYCVLNVLSMIYYLLWTGHWEGGKMSE